MLKKLFGLKRKGMTWGSDVQVKVLADGSHLPSNERTQLDLALSTIF